MIKNLSTVLAAASVTACASVGNLIPDRFDNVEYGTLVELHVLSSYSETCEIDELKQLQLHSRMLAKYSSGTLNQNTAAIYEEINDLVEELMARENPSPTYCRIKRQAITDITDAAIITFGARLK